MSSGSFNTKIVVKLNHRQLVDVIGESNILLFDVVRSKIESLYLLIGNNKATIVKHTAERRKLNKLLAEEKRKTTEQGEEIKKLSALCEELRLENFRLQYEEVECKAANVIIPDYEHSYSK
jgi:hypothetical protein